MLTQGYIPISNSPHSGLKRALNWSSFSINQDIQTAILDTSCHFFNSDPSSPDGYGTEISNQEVREFRRILTATNSTKVNPVNGLHVQDDGNGNLIDALGNVVTSPIGQFDYFFNVIMQQPVKVSDVINQILQTEDTVYKTYDK